MSDSDAPEWNPPEADVRTVDAWRKAGEAVLIDVRETEEYEYEHIPGALLAPLTYLDPAAFPPIGDKRLVILCQSGRRSVTAARMLHEAGFTDLVNMTDGMNAWGEVGLETRGARFAEQDYTI